MIINKKLLIILALVVITTVHHTTADDRIERIEICEELIEEVEIFDAGKKNGISNFRLAFKNLTIKIIKKKIDSIPDNSWNSLMRKEQRELTIGYFRCLLNGINEINDDLGFKDPNSWCKFKVIELKSNGYVDPLEQNEFQVGICNGHIVDVLCPKEAGKIISDRIQAEKNIYTQLYTLGYFNHVATFAIDKRHDPDRFKSIRQYCADEGYKLLPSED